METIRPFVGIDVSSQRLDVDMLPESQRFSEPNTEDGIASLVLRLQALNPESVLLEATPGATRFPWPTPSTRLAYLWSL
jgi:transposase